MKPKRNIINLRKNLPLPIEDILYQVMANYHFTLLSLQGGEAKWEYDPLKPFFATLLKSMNFYEEFANKIQSFFSRDSSAPTYSQLYQEFKRYCKKNEIESIIQKYVEAYFNRFFWDYKLGKHVVPETEPQEPKEVKEAFSNVDWRENPIDFDIDVFTFIIENKPLLESFLILMRSESSYRKDLTTGIPRTKSQKGAPGGDPHGWKQYLNAIIEQIDDLARGNIDEDDPKRGLLIDPEKWFDWYPVRDIPLFEEYPSHRDVPELLLKELYTFGISYQKCHKKPEGKLCTELQEKQELWVKLPKIIRNCVKEKTTLEITTALLIHGFIRGMKETDFVTAWTAYLANYFATAIVVDHIQKDFLKANDETRILTSQMTSNSEKFRQIIWGVGFLIARVFGERSAEQYSYDFSTDKKLRSFTAFQVSAVLFENKPHLDYRYPVLIPNHHIYTVYNSVNKSFSDYYLKPHVDLDV